MHKERKCYEKASVSGTKKGLFLLLILSLIVSMSSGCSLLKAGGVYSDNLSKDKYTLKKPMTDLASDYEFSFHTFMLKSKCKRDIDTKFYMGIEPSEQTLHSTFSAFSKTFKCFDCGNMNSVETEANSR